MEEFITEGRIRVNGKVVNQLGAKVDPDADRIEVNRIPVKAAPKGIMLLNKPRGVVSTLSDPEGRRTVADFLTKHYRSYFPVGRLDWDSTGLMILTNDGEVAERLMHPRYGFERIYQARVEGIVSEELLAKIGRGIKLSDGMVRAEATIIRNQGESTWVEVLICEGRNRVVRRLFDKVGHPVMKLRRTKYGPFRLGKLDVGQTRVLTMKEYQQARRKVMSQGEGDGDARRSFKSEHPRGGGREKFSREERPNRTGSFSKDRRGSSKRFGNQGRKPTVRRRRG